MSARDDGRDSAVSRCARSLFLLFQIVVTPFYAVAMLALVWLPPRAALPDHRRAGAR